MDKKYNRSKHNCKLNPVDVEHELPRTPPYASTTAKLLSNFLVNWMTASRSYPNSSKYLRSTLALYMEKRRQLINRHYRMIIHPLSKFAMLLHSLMVVLWLIAFILDPILATFYSSTLDEDNYRISYEQFQLFLGFFFTFNILQNFFEGFINPRTEHIVLSQKKIVRRYLSTYFFFDLVPVLYDMVCFLFQDTPFGDTLTMTHLYCLRFVRIHTLLVYLREIMSIFKVGDAIIRCVSIVLVQLLLIHWWTCVFFMVPVIFYRQNTRLPNSWLIKTAVGNKRSLTNVYVEVMLCITCHYIGAGVGNMDTKNPVEMLILSMILICGYAAKIYVIAKILQLFGAINVAEIKYDQFMFQLQQYMVTKKFPNELRQRLHNYYDYRFQKQFFNEHVILSAFSEHLRLEVLLYSCKNLIERVVFLKHAPKKVIGAVVACLKQEVYLPGDVIIKSGGYNENIYFISFGTIAVYLPDGREVTHLEDGHHCGDTNMIVRAEGYDPNVVAVEITEVFYLDKVSFWTVVSQYPELMDQLQSSASYQVGLYNAMMNADQSTVDSKDILTELRQGKILERPQRRKISNSAIPLFYRTHFD